MKLLYDNVLVEQIEDEGVLSLSNDQYIVVKVKKKPSVLPEEVQDRTTEGLLEVGDEILCNDIRDYLIKGKKIYIVRLKDIVCIL